MICHTGDPGPSECQKQWLRISDGQERPSRRSKQAGERQAIPDPGNNHINKLEIIILITAARIFRAFPSCQSWLLNSFHGLTAFTQQHPLKHTVLVPFYRRLSKGEEAGRQGQSCGRGSGRLPRACVPCCPTHWG